jgi:hypothetical protein
MRFLHFLNFDNFFSNISITSVFIYFISVLCANLPFLYFKKSLDLQDLTNLIPILIKSYFSSILLGAIVGLLFEFLQGFFFTDIDILGYFKTYVFLITIMFIINYYYIINYSSWSYTVREDDTGYYISNLENDKKRENYTNTLRQQQITKKRQN